jgi:hypothetical protein
MGQEPMDPSLEEQLPTEVEWRHGVQERLRCG